MVARVTSRPVTTPRKPAESSKLPAVSTATKNKLKAAFAEALKGRSLSWGQAPAGVRYVRVPLKTGRGADQYSYTALIPVGALKPGAKAIDPNKTKGFLIERSGGFAGITQVSGPFSMTGAPLTKKPFFDGLLQGSGRNTDPVFVTEKAPSDAEDGGGSTGGGGRIVTMKYPSDSEDGGSGSVGGGRGTGGAVTEKYPSDAEDGGSGRTGGSAGISLTEKYPSDAEDR